MYAYIKGEIVDISEDNVVLECHDIGYNIKVPFSVIQQLPGIGSQVRILCVIPPMRLTHCRLKC